MYEPSQCKHITTATRRAAIRDGGRYYDATLGRWACPWCEDREAACAELASLLEEDERAPEFPSPVAYAATDARPPYERIYGVGETRQGALGDAKQRAPTVTSFRVVRATARLVEAANSVGPGGNLWGVFQDSHGDFADLAGPDGERLPAEAGEGWKP